MLQPNLSFKILTVSCIPIPAYDCAIFLVNLKLAPLSQILFAEPSPTPAKYALSLMGKCNYEVREPLYELSSQTKAQIKKTIKALNLLYICAKNFLL